MIAEELMKVLVKSSATRQFVAENGTWTSDPSQARDFVTSSNAVLFCSLHALHDSELILMTPYQELGLPWQYSHSERGHPLDD